MTATTSLLAGFLCNQVLAAEALSGRPQVLDGDTLRLRGTIVGLYGIAAPGLAQRCERGKGEPVACGEKAAHALAAHIGAASIACQPRGIDEHRRTLAVCRLGEEDLGAWLVSNGFAVADRLKTRDYVAQDAQAWAMRRGLWASVFEDPTERRRDDYAAKLQLSVLDE